MSTFSTYNTLLEQKLANVSELFYDTEMKRQETNNTIKEILQKYDVPEMMKRATLTITSGKVAKPTDYVRMAKLWEIDVNGIELNEHLYLVPDIFDEKAATAAYWWTEDYDTTDDTRKLFIRPTSTTSLEIRYIKSFTEMTDDLTDSGLSSNWDEAVAMVATSKLLKSANRYDESQQYEAAGWQQVAEAYLSLKNPGGIKQNNRLKSKYERVSQLGVNQLTSINI